MNTEPLTGEALLTRLYELSSESLSDKALECGYDLTQEDDQFEQFLEAILTAQNNGVFLGAPPPKDTVKTMNGHFTVRSDGSIVIDDLLTRQMGCMPGDEFEIKLERGSLQLHVVGFG